MAQSSSGQIYSATLFVERWREVVKEYPLMVGTYQK
jgi:hypothetical protein